MMGLRKFSNKSSNHPVATVFFGQVKRLVNPLNQRFEFLPGCPLDHANADRQVDVLFKMRRFNRMANLFGQHFGTAQIKVRRH